MSVAARSVFLGRQLDAIFGALMKQFGRQGWWPARHEFEVVAGALLVQNTTWTNAQAALDNLRAAGKLSVAGVLGIGTDQLQELVRPSGCYRQKARKLQAFAVHVRNQHDGRLSEMLDQPMDLLRNALLGIWGVGEETADSIILYAAQQPSFVVGAYTRRILKRLGLVAGDIRAGELRALLMVAIPPDLAVYSEGHALLVQHGKTFCRKTPRCATCPLVSRCRYGRGSVVHETRSGRTLAVAGD